jgi:hypothetical protein
LYATKVIVPFEGNVSDNENYLLKILEIGKGRAGTGAYGSDMATLQRLNSMMVDKPVEIQLKLMATSSGLSCARLR